MASLNSFGDHAPKSDWLKNFFEAPQTFLSGYELSNNQRRYFKKFLRDANLLEKKNPTTLAFQLKNFGWDKESALAVILVNLVIGNVQVRWYVENFPLEKSLSRNEVEDLLFSANVTKKSAGSIIRSFRRLTETALGTVLNFGRVTLTGRKLTTLTRTKPTVTDGRVILFSLYKFAEYQNTYQFSLSRLLAEPLSPTQIFGIGREEMEQFLNGLSANFPQFIDATFTHDLEKITLSSKKNPTDILTLFEV